MNNLQLILGKEQMSCLRNNLYMSKNIFSLVYDPIKENKIKLNLLPESCREIVCDHLRNNFTHKEKFDVKKLRLLSYNKLIGFSDSRKLTKRQRSLVEHRKVEYDKEMAVSLKIINIIEKEFKWPLTKIYLPECKQLNENHIFYYFEGSKKWVKSPNILSLFMLLIRVSSSLKKHTEFGTLDGFHKSLCNNNNTMYVSYLKTHYKRWLLALKYYDRLFGKISMRDLYLPDTKSSLFNEGINTLCDLFVKDLDLRKKFAKVLKENEILKSWEV
ncbi:MAG: hypothetical protein E3J47_05915 [Candidatus Stahlbacteria bacterium]|nr:MAG: hypothetical protein E3J47_05915 [Candidatus Stahlbacteria bacterium]